MMAETEAAVTTTATAPQTEQDIMAKRFGVVRVDPPGGVDGQKSGAVRQWINGKSKIQVELTDGRVLTGIFSCFDAQRNIILQEAYEERKIMKLDSSSAGPKNESGLQTESIAADKESQTNATSKTDASTPLEGQASAGATGATKKKKKNKNKKKTAPQTTAKPAGATSEMKTGPNELVDESLLSEIEARDFDNKRHERLTVRVDLEKSAERRYVGLVLIAFKHAVKVRLDKNSINAEPAESSASEPKK